MLGEISRTEKDIPHDLTYMWYLKIIMKAYMKVVESRLKKFSPQGVKTIP